MCERFIIVEGDSIEAVADTLDAAKKEAEPLASRSSIAIYQLVGTVELVSRPEFKGISR